jgi:hypothetical protein
MQVPPLLLLLALPALVEPVGVAEPASVQPVGVSKPAHSPAHPSGSIKRDIKVRGVLFKYNQHCVTAFKKLKMYSTEIIDKA